MSPVPSGTKETFCRPCGTLKFGLRFLSHEWLGYFQRSLPCDVKGSGREQWKKSNFHSPLARAVMAAVKQKPTELIKPQARRYKECVVMPRFWCEPESQLAGTPSRHSRSFSSRLLTR
jgi:hypothetical protein